MFLVGKNEDKESGMKRQRSVQGSGTNRLQTTKTTSKKKAKTRVGHGKEEVAAAAEVVLVGRNRLKEDREFAEIVKAEEMLDWDIEWPCSWVAVDEQMSWGTFWSPSWDMEFIDGEAYHALYDDVLWEDDIWDLKDIKNVPSSFSG